MDGKPAQAIERGDVPVEVLSDRELFAIIRRRPIPNDATNRRLISPPLAAKNIGVVKTPPSLTSTPV